MSLDATEGAARTHQAEAGWSDASLVLLLCRFIESHKLTDEMAAYLRAQAEMEAAIDSYDEDTGAEGL